MAKNGVRGGSDEPGGFGEGLGEGAVDMADGADEPEGCATAVVERAARDSPL